MVNLFWSLLLLAAPAAVYFAYLRPRLHESARFRAVYDEIDGVWAGIWRVALRFKKFTVFVLGCLITAAPDLLSLVAPIDFTKVLPEPWPAFTGPICFGIIVLMRAFDPKKEG